MAPGAIGETFLHGRREENTTFLTLSCINVLLLCGWYTLMCMGALCIIGEGMTKKQKREMYDQYGS